MKIYVIENLVNGKKYVGKTAKPINKRFNEHCSLAKTQPNKCYIAKAINKYGKENFTIYEIDQTESEEELNQKEQYWIKELKTFGEGYNLTEGGEGIIGKVFSDESKKKMSQSHKGVKLSEEHRKAAAKGHTGIKCSEAKKDKIRASLLGRKHGPMSEETKLKISTKLKGKIFSEETKQKISEAKMGHDVPKEARDKISKQFTGRKRIYREDGTFYMSSKEQTI